MGVGVGVGVGEEGGGGHHSLSELKNLLVNKSVKLWKLSFCPLYTLTR